MSPAPTLVWFRRDLRLADHPALAAALARGGPVLPVFVLDDRPPWAPGAASRWWLHHSLAALSDDLAARGGRLVLLRGAPEEELPRLATAIGAGAVMWNRRPEPPERDREARLGRALAGTGIEAREFPGDQLFEPGSVRSREGNPFQVFTPFWRAALASPPPAMPLPASPSLPPVAAPPGLALDELGLLPRIGWWRGMADTWRPGEAGAQARLDTFLADGLDAYASLRDRPDVTGTSMLSPHLAFGEISPRQVWHAVAARPATAGSETFLKELGWREFSRHLLAAFPGLPEAPLKREFAAFPWQPEPAGIEAWKRGLTGFPIVDAGMRQLWHTGWMHNRVRMIVASFLVKDLLAPWRLGEDWFWDTLVDADLAANAASWQWVAGCGADAAPFFRVFNPVVQGEKFDPRGRYVRRWVPELAGLPDLAVHRPWEAPPLVLRDAGVSLGRTYPAPILDHGAARKRALAAYQAVTAAKG